MNSSTEAANMTDTDRRIVYACGHEYPAPRRILKEAPSERIKRTLTRVLSFGKTESSTAGRRGTVQSPRAEIIKHTLKRVLSFGKVEKRKLKSTDNCPDCEQSFRSERARFSAPEEEEEEEDTDGHDPHNGERFVYMDDDDPDSSDPERKPGQQRHRKVYLHSYACCPADYSPPGTPSENQNADANQRMGLNPHPNPAEFEAVSRNHMPSFTQVRSRDFL